MWSAVVRCGVRWYADTNRLTGLLPRDVRASARGVTGLHSDERGSLMPGRLRRAAASNPAKVAAEQWRHSSLPTDGKTLRRC